MIERGEEQGEESRIDGEGSELEKKDDEKERKRTKETMGNEDVKMKRNEERKNFNYLYTLPLLFPYRSGEAN